MVVGFCNGVGCTARFSALPDPSTKLRMMVFSGVIKVRAWLFGELTCPR